MLKKIISTDEKIITNSLSNKEFEKLFCIFKEFLNAIPVGVCISVDCLVYLCCDNKIAGVLIFTNGLFTILAILCNALIFVAVHGLNNFKADFMKALA